jgi:hypothetical protein
MLLFFLGVCGEAPWEFLLCILDRFELGGLIYGCFSVFASFGFYCFMGVYACCLLGYSLGALLCLLCFLYFLRFGELYYCCLGIFALLLYVL